MPNSTDPPLPDPASLPPNTEAEVPAQPRPTDGKFAEARDDPAQAEELERQQDA